VLQKLVRGLVYLLAAVAVPLIIYNAARMWSDFVVYHHTARTLLASVGPLYGPDSGLGWPQYFRYPPLFLFAFIPFALLPLPLASGLWATLKFVVLFFLVRALARRLIFPRTGYWWLIPLFLAGPFLIQEFRNGNVQFLVFALTASALLSLHRRPRIAAILLGTAVIFKVWPLYFVPYLAARRQVRVAGMTLVVALLLAMLPALYFGWNGNVSLLHQWAQQEWGTGSLSTAVWYPSQSLGGVLHTYLSETDRSKWPDPNYPNLQVLSVDPVILRALWMTLVVAGYAGLLWVARATSESKHWVVDALAFALLPLLQPFAHRIVFLVLLWPGMVVGALLSRNAFSAKSRVFLYSAITIFVLTPFVPGSHAQRFLQTAGSDFLATCLLSAGLLTACLNHDRPSGDETNSRRLPLAEHCS
jgi:hypothetical protein